MGSMMMMPLPGFNEADYEESLMAQILGNAYARGVYPKAEVFSEYLTSRRKAHDNLRGFYGHHVSGYGVKANLLPRYWKEWEKAVAAVGERMLVIGTSRGEIETSDSLGRCSSAAIEPYAKSYQQALFDEQLRIATALEGIHVDVTIACNQSIEAKRDALRAAGVPLRG